ncbi:hypothetical protein EKH55_2344 [Sinorhizobium alkalisoli]|nr:hypothetical protein EKH55_2344 [Sinorhizobium alkalisoli]
MTTPSAAPSALLRYSTAFVPLEARDDIEACLRQRFFKLEE